MICVKCNIEMNWSGYWNWYECPKCKMRVRLWKTYKEEEPQHE